MMQNAYRHSFVVHNQVGNWFVLVEQAKCVPFHIFLGIISSLPIYLYQIPSTLNSTCEYPLSPVRVLVALPKFLTLAMQAKKFRPRSQ